MEVGATPSRGIGGNVELSVVNSTDSTFPPGGTAASLGSAPPVKVSTGGAPWTWSSPSVVATAVVAASTDTGATACVGWARAPPSGGNKPVSNQQPLSPFLRRELIIGPEVSLQVRSLPTQRSAA